MRDQGAYLKALAANTMQVTVTPIVATAKTVFFLFADRTSIGLFLKTNCDTAGRIAKVHRLLNKSLLTSATSLGLIVFPAHAQDVASANSFGMPGLVEMPTALSFGDADLVASLTLTDTQQRNTLAFQITPRLTGALRYSIIDNYRGGGNLFDRSFDFHYQLLDEDGWQPSVAIGLRDFVGTGVFSSEYIVASKHLSPHIIASAGIGWGEMADRDGFRNPLSGLDPRFEDRPRFEGKGGEANFGQWFRGDAALFGGVSWQVNDRLMFSGEYSSAGKELSTATPSNDRSPLNFGIQYQATSNLTLAAQYMQGDTFGATAHYTLNPRVSPAGGDLSPAPAPIAVRGEGSASWAGGMLHDAIPTRARVPTLAAVLEAEGIELQQVEITGNTARVRILNERYDSIPQAIGRTARFMSLLMPTGVETFHIEMVENGVPLSRVTLQRADLERLEYTPDAINASLAAARIGPSGPSEGLTALSGAGLEWGLGPYIGLAFFDPDNPLRADIGLELSASYAFTPSLSLSGALRGKVIGNRNESTRESDSVLPRVRSDQPLYDQNGEYGVETLTLDHFGKIGTDLYTRASFGYLEEMFGGISTEVLWKPVDSRLAIGAELNHVMQRDTDKLFGFDEYDYAITTGHVSGYYSLENGFDVQLDMGRYLAGDWGATLSVDRRFGNGWRVGAFATLTDVPFEDFGEGSFDKGIRVTIPVSWVLGQPTRATGDVTLRSLQRDGGARLGIGNRLYETIRDYHKPELTDQWGRFWR